ncbi:conserved domain protein [Bacteroides fluxus YIT 12057]|uniref:Conserved domain protein n=1 Tax=Bacteroides fluxus YIT 12057 TaxID=763034 RepID=F3PNG8_9BACE|nr:conserved domain protein [Bacteroides fluxus YIT 12057]
MSSSSKNEESYPSIFLIPLQRYGYYQKKNKEIKTKSNEKERKKYKT